MNIEEIKQRADQFQQELRAQVSRQAEELNLIVDGELQDGYNLWYLDDGWVSLKGYSWGFSIVYDSPPRIDMTFGPGWPFVGYRSSFVARPIGGRLAWVNASNPAEIFFDAHQLARLGLRKLACKAGDGYLFDEKCAGLQLEGEEAVSDSAYGGIS